MGLTNIKKELSKLDKDKLISLVTEIYKKSKSAKEFLDFYVNPNEIELFKKYKDKILEAFYPKRGYNYKLKDGKQAISDFKKLGSSLELLADLMLFYVETGIRFTNDLGDINESFYKSLATSFMESLRLMKKEDLLGRFEARVEKIVDDTRGVGWGLHDCLMQAWMDFYPEEDEDSCSNEREEIKETDKLIKLQTNTTKG